MLSVHEPEFEQEWIEWANECPGAYRFFLNGKTDFESLLPRIADEVRDTRWGTHSLAVAEIALLRAALRDEAVTHLVVVQGDALPVRPLGDLLDLLEETGDLSLFDPGGADEKNKSDLRSNFESACLTCSDESNWWRDVYFHPRPSKNVHSRRHAGYSHQCCLLSRLGAEQVVRMPIEVFRDYDSLCGIDASLTLTDEAARQSKSLTYFMGAEEIVFEAWIRVSLGPRLIRHVPLMYCEPCATSSSDGRHAALLTTRLGSQKNYFARKFARGVSESTRAFKLARVRRRALKAS